MRAASACIIEFLARLFPFRQFSNETRARVIFMLGEGDEDIFAESQFTRRSQFPVACGPSARTTSDTDPSRVNLTAFATRLVKICRTRLRSAFAMTP